MDEAFRGKEILNILSLRQTNARLGKVGGINVNSVVQSPTKSRCEKPSGNAQNTTRTRCSFTNACGVGRDCKRHYCQGVLPRSQCVRGTCKRWMFTLEFLQFDSLVAWPAVPMTQSQYLVLTIIQIEFR